MKEQATEWEKCFQKYIQDTFLYLVFEQIFLFSQPATNYREEVKMFPMELTTLIEIRCKNV